MQHRPLLLIHHCRKVGFAPRFRALVHCRCDFPCAGMRIAMGVPMHVCGFPRWEKLCSMVRSVCLQPVEALIRKQSCTVCFPTMCSCEVLKEV